LPLPPNVNFLCCFVIHLQLQLLSLSKIQKQLVTIRHMIPKSQVYWCFQHLQKQWAKCIKYDRKCF
jgi:hypothetical protein